jgi:hypothetical protein
MDPQKKNREQGLKSKRGETSYEEIHVTKKEDEIYKLLGEILSKERQKGITFSYRIKSDVWPHPHPHIICICNKFYSLTWIRVGYIFAQN